jgi:two-component system KDP operon response regulator KdpE
MSEAIRVLVCDDEPQILRALRVILRDAGYEAVTAASGEEALDHAAVSRRRRRSST